MHVPSCLPLDEVSRACLKSAVRTGAVDIARVVANCQK